MTDITTSELPPLPEPADTALVEGVAMQGSEYRTLSRDYEEWTARYSVRQMREYALAALSHARSVAPGGLTDEQCRTIFCALNNWARTAGVDRYGLPLVVVGGELRGIQVIKEALAATPTTVHPTPADVPAQVVADSRPCTCHPDDNPPRPCPRKYALSECRAAAIPKGVDAGKPGYLHALIDHLLMPPPAMTESHLRKLHNEVAEMLNLFSKHLKRMASTSLGHAMKVEAQASQALTQYNAGSTGQGDAGGVTGQCPVCHVEDGQHQRGCRNIPGVKGEGNG
jgi:hypothetical protein